MATRLWKKFYDVFSCFDRIPACDGQTDRQPYFHRKIRDYTLSIARQWRRNEIESGRTWIFLPCPHFLKCTPPPSGGAQCTVLKCTPSLFCSLKLVYSWSRCNILTRLLCDNNLVMTDIERLMNVSTYFSDSGNNSSWTDHFVYIAFLYICRFSRCSSFFYGPSPRPRGSARRKTASSLILRGHV